MSQSRPPSPPTNTPREGMHEVINKGKNRIIPDLEMQALSQENVLPPPAIPPRPDSEVISVAQDPYHVNVPVKTGFLSTSWEPQVKPIPDNRIDFSTLVLELDTAAAQLNVNEDYWDRFRVRITDYILILIAVSEGIRILLNGYFGDNNETSLNTRNLIFRMVREVLMAVAVLIATWGLISENTDAKMLHVASDSLAKLNQQEPHIGRYYTHPRSPLEPVVIEPKKGPTFFGWTYQGRFNQGYLSFPGNRCAAYSEINSQGIHAGQAITIANKAAASASFWYQVDAHVEKVALAIYYLMLIMQTLINKSNGRSNNDRTPFNLAIDIASLLIIPLGKAIQKFARSMRDDSLQAQGVAQASVTELGSPFYRQRALKRN